MSRRIIIAMLIFISAEGCVDPLEIASPVNRYRIIVDAQLTDQQGPHVVRIFSIFGTAASVTPVQGAGVKIIDDTGVETSVTEVTPGVYETSADFRGVEGRSYKLHFITNDARAYESSLQQMHPAGRITNIYKEYDPQAFETDKPLDIGEGFRFSIDAEGTPGALNLFRWRSKITYELVTLPHLHTKYILLPGSDSLTRVPDPLECSGMILDDLGNFRPVAECTCCSCWMDEYSPTTKTSDNKLVSQSLFKKVLISKTRIEPLKFQVRYYVRIEQLSLTEEMYAFWRKVEQQQEAGDNIFQPNAIQIQGNVRCLSNPSEEVSGVFGVSAVAWKDVFVERSEIPLRFEVIRPANDCRLSYPESTNIKPPFW